MMVSTKGRYALQVMIDLAEHDPDIFIPLKEIAERQGISEKYLESILVVLSKAGLLIGLRGKNGGYRLARAPKDYTIGSILKLTEGSLAPVSCLECSPNQCSKTSDCPTLPMWEELDKMINNYFENISLADLISRKAPSAGPRGACERPV